MGILLICSWKIASKWQKQYKDWMGKIRFIWISNPNAFNISHILMRQVWISFGSMHSIVYVCNFLELSCTKNVSQSKIYRWFQYTNLFSPQNTFFHWTFIGEKWPKKRKSRDITQSFNKPKNYRRGSVLINCLGCR